MSKITNDGLTRSGTGCFVAILIWQRVSRVKSSYLYCMVAVKLPWH